MDLKGLLIEQDLLAALKSTSNGKSPGSNEYTVEFFKFFWHDIKQLVLNRMNMGFEKGKMSITQRHGIIILLPKKDKDTLVLKTLGPISLLNIDYKLAAKCIATRIKKHLSSLIHNNQTGFLKYRYIGENINRILSILNLTDEVLVDFEKASLQWSFIE